MNDAYVWILIVAIFWIPPFFVAAWLGDVKRSSDRDTPVMWGLLGWLGTLVYGLMRSSSARNVTEAAARSRIVVFVSLLGLCGVAALMVYDYDRASSPAWSSSEVGDSLLESLRDSDTDADGYSPQSVACVHRSGGEFSCVATFYVSTTGLEEHYSYIANCDAVQCVWRDG